MRNRVITYFRERDRNFICKFIADQYEILAYIFFGVLTSLVDIVIYAVLEKLLGQDMWFVSNFPAVTLSILFAYVANRVMVFGSKGNFWTEMLKFFLARAFSSLIFEYGVIFIPKDVFNITSVLNLFIFSISWFKIISLAFVVVANYIMSKFLVFKKANSGAEVDAKTKDDAQADSSAEVGLNTDEEV